VGNVVSQNATVLVNVVSLKPVWAYINVDQNTALRVQALVRAGEIKAVRGDTLPVGMSVGPGTNDRFPVGGVIDYVGNQVDPNTGTIQARAVFPNEDLSLVAGLFARIRVPMSASHKALLVNDMALGTNQGQKYLFVVNDKDEVEYRGVDVGQVHDGLREVLPFRTIVKSDSSGADVTEKVEVLKSTDRVLVNGLQRVRPGVKVDPKMVDMQTLLVVTGAETKAAPPADSK
jgi:multidrug efflux system membrane fusion protein